MRQLLPVRSFGSLRCLRASGVAILFSLLLVLTGAVSLTVTAQQQKPLIVKPDLPNQATNHRLILKDGSYQIVRKYEVKGDRVRYISVERGGEWEELPSNLVDWDATRKWERDHANQADMSTSDAMKEAREIDREEASERQEMGDHSPEVADGLNLPDEDSVFVLDTFQGKQELVELLPTDLGQNSKNKRRLNVTNQIAGATANLELDGAHAKVHLHVNDPVIYLSLAPKENAEKVLSHAVTMDTGGAREAVNRKHGAHSAKSSFALVRLGERKAIRVLDAIQFGPQGSTTVDDDVQPAKVEVAYDMHWLKVTAPKPLKVGEYALVEMLANPKSPGPEMNQMVWDFRVDPSMGDNPGSLDPIQKESVR